MGNTNYVSDCGIWIKASQLNQVFALYTEILFVLIIIIIILKKICTRCLTHPPNRRATSCVHHGDKPSQISPAVSGHTLRWGSKHSNRGERILLTEASCQLTLSQCTFKWFTPESLKAHTDQTAHHKWPLVYLLLVISVCLSQHTLYSKYNILIIMYWYFMNINVLTLSIVFISVALLKIL